MRASIQDFLKYSISLCIVLSIMLPVTLQALEVLSDSMHGYQLMAMDLQEESQKKEQQEDNTEDEKIEMSIISTYNRLHSSISKHVISRTLHAASNFIKEIPIPPPERF